MNLKTWGKGNRTSLINVGLVILATIGATTIGAAMINRKVVSEDHLKLVYTLIATFTGGFLAYMSNRAIQQTKEQAENRMALSLAAFTILSNFDDLLNCRRTLRQEIKQQHDKFLDQGVEQPPFWLVVRPIRYPFIPGKQIDYKALSFLLKTPAGYEAFRRMQNADQAHTALKSDIDSLHDAATEALKQIAAEMAREHSDGLSLPRLEKYVTADIKGRVKSYIISILMRGERDISLYRNTLTALTNEAKRNWPDVEAKDWNLYVAENIVNLPALPAHLQQALDDGIEALKKRHTNRSRP